MAQDIKVIERGAPVSKARYARTTSAALTSTGAITPGFGLPSRPGFWVPKAAEMLAAHLRQKIIRGELRDGDHLPSEPNLISQLGVSRSTLREAFLLLSADGFLSISRGARKGARIHRPSVQAASRQMNFIMQANNVTLDDLWRSLTIFEPAVVRALAENAGKAEIRLLREKVAQLEASIDDDHAFAVHIAQFHRYLAHGTGLRSIGLIMEQLADLVGAYVEAASASQMPQMSRPGKVKAVLTRQKLIGLIEKRAGAAAEALWRRHLEVTREIMLRVTLPTSIQELYQSS
jgi:DNA-binding FadR family transcriptional regulator